MQISQIAARVVSYSTIVATAGAESSHLTEELTLTPWRISSGFAHAKPGATLALLDLEESRAVTEGVLDLRVTAPNSGLLVLTQIAKMMIQRFRMVRPYTMRGELFTDRALSIQGVLPLRYCKQAPMR